MSTLTLNKTGDLLASTKAQCECCNGRGVVPIRSIYRFAKRRKLRAPQVIPCVHCVGTGVVGGKDTDTGTTRPFVGAERERYIDFKQRTGNMHLYNKVGEEKAKE